jgi:tRNA-specific 2-thiouridylase
MVSPAQVELHGETVVARLGTPQRGVAAGQALVMYDGDEVIGSATITGATRAAAHSSVSA